MITFKLEVITINRSTCSTCMKFLHDLTVCIAGDQIFLKGPSSRRLSSHQRRVEEGFHSSKLNARDCNNSPYKKRKSRSGKSCSGLMQPPTFYVHCEAHHSTGSCWDCSALAPRSSVRQEVDNCFRNCFLFLRAAAG